VLVPVPDADVGWLNACVAEPESANADGMRTALVIATAAETEMSRAARLLRPMDTSPLADDWTPSTYRKARRQEVNIMGFPSAVVVAPLLLKPLTAPVLGDGPPAPAALFGCFVQ
jgi:hypothetical protein